MYTLKELGIIDLAVELVDIDEINEVGYKNTIDISVEDDETFVVNSIISHNSAKGSVMAGLSVIGREYYGAFPIRGKALNVRNAPTHKITQNAEISNICKILGLVPGKKYTSLDELRYGKIVFFTDNDLDGISIKGLLINFFHIMFPELLDLGFCYEFLTPIIVAKKGKEKKSYYSLIDYENDKHNLKDYKIKYFKGLGTWEPEEMKQIFKDLGKHLIKFNFNGETDDELIKMVFDKDYADNRKEWLLNRDSKLLVKNGEVSIDDFFNNEFIEFSNYDNIRSIPSLVDGLKPSQRKIIYASILKNLKEEIKVAQFGAYTAEQTEYKHNEVSLQETIIKMAQTFVGSNNINLLMPNGNFASRTNPDSAASPRYIYTELNKVFRYIYRKEDDCILNYLEDDGKMIEPEYYFPIIPMILVNGTNGIGTGWSSDVLMYNPLDVINNIKLKLNNKKLKDLMPYYRGFKGTIEKSDNGYISNAVYTKTKNGIHITELPVNVYIEKYTTHLNSLVTDKKIKSYIDNSTDNDVNIQIIFNENTKLQHLNLTSKLSSNNMNLFDKYNKIK